MGQQCGEPHLGSVALTTDANGNLASSQEFKPWGEVRSGGVSQTTINYTGQKLDSTGLLYYNARYYDPVLARFISADNIEIGAGATQELNRYSYVDNNPLLFTDPSGHYADVPAGSDVNYAPNRGLDSSLARGTWLNDPDTGAEPGVKTPYPPKIAPSADGKPQYYYRTNSKGQVMSYQEYDAQGYPVKRVDVVGLPHKNVEQPSGKRSYVETPHTQDLNPDNSYKGPARASTPGEIPSNPGEGVTPGPPSPLDQGGSSNTGSDETSGNSDSNGSDGNSTGDQGSTASNGEGNPGGGGCGAPPDQPGNSCK